MQSYLYIFPNDIFISKTQVIINSNTRHVLRAGPIHASLFNDILAILHSDNIATLIDINSNSTRLVSFLDLPDSPCIYSVGSGSFNWLFRFDLPILPRSYLSRILVIGKSPCLALYAEKSSTRINIIGTSLVSLAKSLWEESQPIQLPRVLAVWDDRIFTTCTFSPPSLITSRSTFAALTDNLARVWIFNLETGEFCNMFKGMRGAQCSWMHFDQRVFSINKDKHSTTP